MAATNESALTFQIAKAVTKAHPGSWVIKVHGGPYQEAGIPDLLCCVEGLLIGLEVKHQKPGESAEHARSRATVGQRAQIDRITRAGGTAAVVLSIEEALAVVSAALANHGH